MEEAPRKSPRGRALWLLLAAAGLGAWVLWPASASQRAAWLADFDRLERHTAQAYANLGDRLRSRQLSPRALDEAARAALGRARYRRQARSAAQRFVAAFDDAHFRAEAPYGPARRLLRRLLGKDRRRESAAIAGSAAGSDACAALGARDRRHGRIDWSALPGFEPTDRDPATHPFPAGVLRSEGARPIAILRIGLFDELGFPEHCAAAWERFRAARPAGAGDCDEACQDEFRDALEESFLLRFAAQLAELDAAGADTLLLDLTDNGGGRGIVGPMTRMLSARPLRPRSGGFIRHPHWATRFSEMAGELQAELARADLTPRQREILEGALARVEAALHEAETRCDLSAMWRLEGPDLPCSNVGRTGPWVDAVRPEEVAGLATRRLLGVAGDDDRPVAWRGALYLVANRRTASASEDLLASLQDAGAARVVGERSMGIGCGYTNGGVVLDLAALGLTVRAPDCVRFRADGRNEAEGVEPDIAVPWKDGDDDDERARKTIAALPF